jgi:hypothetical protein
LADRGIVSPFLAMWSADMLIGTVGAVLLWSVTNEVALAPRSFWRRLTSRWRTVGGKGPAQGAER